jgi:ABC-type uncharacterized transport system permease subunit
MNWAAILTSFKIGMRRVAGEKVALAGQVVVYGVLLLAYGVLFRGISPQAMQHFDIDRVQLTWYFVLTQAQVACCYMHYREMEHIIRSGGIEAMLLRPASFGWLTLAEWFGQYVMRLALVLPGGCIGALLIAGQIPPHPLRMAMLAVPCLCMGGLIFLCVHFATGCSVLWTETAEPVFRLAQKSIYFLGARSWPLLLYPILAQGFVWLTPFPAVMAVPGDLATNLPHTTILLQVGAQILWTVAALACAGWIVSGVRNRVLSGVA